MKKRIGLVAVFLFLSTFVFAQDGKPNSSTKAAFADADYNNILKNCEDSIRSSLYNLKIIATETGNIPNDYSKEIWQPVNIKLEELPSTYVKQEASPMLTFYKKGQKSLSVFPCLRDVLDDHYRSTGHVVKAYAFVVYDGDSSNNLVFFRAPECKEGLR